MRPSARPHPIGELLARAWSVERFLGGVALAAALVIAGPPGSPACSQRGPDRCAPLGSQRQGETTASRHDCAAAGLPLILATAAQRSGRATPDRREGK